VRQRVVDVVRGLDATLVEVGEAAAVFARGELAVGADAVAAGSGRGFAAAVAGGDAGLPSGGLAAGAELLAGAGAEAAGALAPGGLDDAVVAAAGPVAGELAGAIVVASARGAL